MTDQEMGDLGNRENVDEVEEQLDEIDRGMLGVGIADQIGAAGSPRLRRQEWSERSGHLRRVLPTGRNGRCREAGRSSTSSPTSPIPSSCSGRSALVVEPPDDRSRDVEPRERRASPSRERRILVRLRARRSGCARYQLSMRGQCARLRPSHSDIASASSGRDHGRRRCGGAKLLSKNVVESHPRDPAAPCRGRERRSYIGLPARWAGSSIRLFWKIRGCGELTMASRVIRGSPRSRGEPRDRAAPIVPDQSETHRCRAHRRARTGRRAVHRSHRRRHPAGLSVAPNPRWSGMIMRNWSSSSGTSLRQVRCDSGKPWSRISRRSRHPDRPVRRSCVIPVESANLAMLASWVAHRLGDYREAG